MSEVKVPVTKRPMTGAEYLEGLRDGREIWLHGERVKDVTSHPAFRNAARMVARLYDALHDPTQEAVLTTETDTGSAGRTHSRRQDSPTVLPSTAPLGWRSSSTSLQDCS